MRKDLSSVYDLIRADGSIVLNKNLCFAIGLDATLVYSELLSRYNYFNIREELDEEGYFFNTIDDFERATTLDDKQQKKAIDRLANFGLIKTKLKGVPARRHFLIIDDITLLFRYIDTGKKRIEILEEKQKAEKEKKIQKRKEREELRSSQINQQFTQNGETGSSISTEQDSAIWGHNNTKVNNTTFNNTNSNINGGAREPEVREGTLPIGKDTPNNSLPFYDYFMGLLKDCKTNYKQQILETVIYYYGKYYEKFSVEHIRYKRKSCLVVIDKLDTLYYMGIAEENMDRFLKVNLQDVKGMIDKHFETKYKKNSYTLLSFLNDNILKNRYHEVVE
ncbi:hypothetical protein ACPUYX_20755 [Desulfosporosinus sp. SYSU MS00001]|uniref:hypothetical protein n=1 Tax=Desulfosporosinus sp. SYSU MS00001 TaxID=3416284 RepID=UPI003CFAB0FE